MLLEFSLYLSVASTYHSHGFDERKIETHAEYCKHLLDAAKIHRDAAEQTEQQNKQKMEVARQIALADESRRRAKEQRKLQVYLFLVSSLHLLHGHYISLQQ
jgi:RNA polymerase-associated protein CTR9